MKWYLIYGLNCYYTYLEEYETTEELIDAINKLTHDDLQDFKVIRGEEIINNKILKEYLESDDK